MKEIPYEDSDDDDFTYSLDDVLKEFRSVEKNEAFHQQWFLNSILFRMCQMLDMKYKVVNWNINGIKMIIKIKRVWSNLMLRKRSF